MAQLVVLLGTGKGSWAHVGRLIRQSDFEEVIIVTNQFGRDKFSVEKKSGFVVTDFDQPVHTLRHDIISKLRPLIKGPEVGFNMVSGAGKEHMALLSAVLGLGVGVRLVVAGENDFAEL
ncbi:MAG: hypothetical protein ACLFTH_03065 [Candidatus Woesearchaeota archaeon]